MYLISREVHSAYLLAVETVIVIFFVVFAYLGNPLVAVVAVVAVVYGRVIYICILLGLGFGVYSCEYSVLVVGCMGYEEYTPGTVVVAREEAVAMLLVLVACQHNVHNSEGVCKAH